MIAIGRIAKSVGIKGEVKVMLLTDHPQRISLLKRVWVGEDDEGGTEYQVETVRFQDRHAVMKFYGIDSRSASDSLKSFYVLIPDDQAIRGSGETLFLHEVVGLTVVTEEGVTVGEVEDVVKLPGGDMWVVRNGVREILIPGVKEFIRKVDLERREVRIHAIEGLLE